MHVAAFESIDNTSLEGNTSPAMIKQTYLDIVSRAEARKYWAIHPRSQILSIDRRSPELYQSAEHPPGGLQPRAEPLVAIMAQTDRWYLI